MSIVNVQTTTEKLLVQKDGPVGWIVFNNPARHNAVSMSMWESIPGALKVFEDSGRGTFGYLEKALQWVIDPRGRA